MAKLYFRYGTMGSAKTLNLLAVAHNYRQQSKKIFPEEYIDLGEGIFEMIENLHKNLK